MPRITDPERFEHCMCLFGIAPILPCMLLHLCGALCVRKASPWSREKRGYVSVLAGPGLAGREPAARVRDKRKQIGENEELQWAARLVRRGRRALCLPERVAPRPPAPDVRPRTSD